MFFFVPPALCVTRYGVIPLVATLIGFARAHDGLEADCVVVLGLPPMCDVKSQGVDYPDIENLNRQSLIAKGTALMFGGPSLWGTVIKIKSRLLPLFYGPRRILSGECPFRRLYAYTCMYSSTHTPCVVFFSYNVCLHIVRVLTHFVQYMLHPLSFQAKTPARGALNGYDGQTATFAGDRIERSVRS